jgi:hypothetical protein
LEDEFECSVKGKKYFISIFHHTFDMELDGFIHLLLKFSKSMTCSDGDAIPDDNASGVVAWSFSNRGLLCFVDVGSELCCRGEVVIVGGVCDRKFN